MSPSAPCSRSRRALLERLGLVGVTLGLAGCGSRDRTPDPDPASATAATTPTADPAPAWTTSLPAGLGVRFGEDMTTALAPTADRLGVLSTGAASVYGLDTTTGGETWQVSFDGEPMDVNAYDGDLFVLCADRTTARLASDGRERWRTTPTPRTDVADPVQPGRSLFLAADDTRLYFITGPGDDDFGPRAQLLYALDRADGSLAWASLAAGGAYHARRVTAAGEELLVVGSTAHGLAAYAVADGTRVWDTRPGPQPLVEAGDAGARFGAYRRLIVADGCAFGVTSDSETVAVDVATGERRWARSVSPVVTAHTATEDAVVVLEHAESADIRARGFDLATGADRFRAEIGVLPASEPVPHDGVLYCPMMRYPTGSAPVVDLTALDLATGTDRWTVPMADPSPREPVVSLAAGDAAIVLAATDNDDPSFADTSVTAVTPTDGTVAHELALSDHAGVAATADAVYVAAEYAGTVSRFDA